MSEFPKQSDWDLQLAQKMQEYIHKNKTLTRKKAEEFMSQKCTKLEIIASFHDLDQENNEDYYTTIKVEQIAEFGCSVSGVNADKIIKAVEKILGEKNG